MPRPLTPKERDLVAFILGQHSPFQDHFGLVDEMNDGGMDSLLFVGAAGRRFARCIGECEFDDADGVLVSVALNLDQRDELFELDLWKVDFSPLQRIPALGDVRPSGWLRQKPR